MYTTFTAVDCNFKLFAFFFWYFILFNDEGLFSKKKVNDSGQVE